MAGIDAFDQLVLEHERTLFMFYGYREADGRQGRGYFKLAQSLSEALTDLEANAGVADEGGYLVKDAFLEAGEDGHVIHVELVSGARSSAAHPTRGGVMARPATGTVAARKLANSDTRYALRFRVNGERMFETLGTDSEGWDHRRAEEALQDRLAEVRLGTYIPPRPVARATESDNSNGYRIVLGRPIALLERRRRAWAVLGSNQ
jgi:hypothetical protein